VPVLLGEEPPLLHVLREMHPIAVTRRLAQRALDWWERRSNCTPPDIAPAEPPERRVAVLVAGLGTTSDGASVGDVDLAELGYDPADVVGFSYAGGRTPDAFGASSGPVSADLATVPVSDYGPEDSTTDLPGRGAALADLLTALADASPGTTVDLFAHSQGGVVARLALAELATRPGGQQVIESLGLVATMGTPHDGADLATLALLAAETGEGALGLAVADRLLDLPLDPGAATNLVDLAVGSDLLDAASDAGLPEGPAYLSVAGRGDMVVLTARSRLDGATNVVVPVDGISSHSALPADPATTRELALALAGMPPTCESFFDFVVDSGVAEVLHTGTLATSGAVAQWTVSSVVPDWLGAGAADLLPG
jgi:pimeloyl-ACP methyl ester carboxylesterase